MKFRLCPLFRSMCSIGLAAAVAVTTAAPLFAHEDDVFVAGDFLCEGGADGFAVSDDGHGMITNYELRVAAGCSQSKNSRPLEARWAGLSVSQ